MATTFKGPSGEITGDVTSLILQNLQKPGEQK